MRLKIKLCGMLLSLVIMINLISNASAANTATPYFGKRMENGIGSVTVYIDSGSGATYWQRLIKDAVYNWMYTGVGANKFYATYVSSNKGSKVDIYAKPSNYWANTSTMGETSFFSSAIKEVYPSQDNWYSANIFLNDTFLRQNIVSDALATGTIGHELGHAFGLAHNNTNPNSLLCQFSWGRAVNKVQKVDNDALNYLY